MNLHRLEIAAHGQSEPGSAPPATWTTYAPHVFIPMLLVLTFATFAGVLSCGFVNFDDPGYVTDNPFVQQGLTRETVHWALTSRIQNLYHPVTLLSLALDGQLFGINPAAFHAENLLLHCMNVVLLYLLLRRMTGSEWRSVLVASIFAVHPLRVESVAWVTERKDMLMAVFGLMCFHAYISYVRKPGWRRYVLIVLSLAISLLAKPSLMVMPILFLLLDVWPLGRTSLWPERGDGANPRPPLIPAAEPLPPLPWRRLAVEKLPLLAVCVVVTAIAVFGGHAVAPMPPNAGGMFKLSDRLSNMMIAYARYFITMIDFRGLAAFYPILRSWPLWQIIASTAFLVCGTLFVIAQIRKRPWLAVGWFWFVILLLPVSGLVQSFNYLSADRYTYMSSIGLLVGIAWSLPASLGAAVSGRMALGTATLALLAVLVTETAHHVHYWHDSTALWGHALEVTHDNWLAECSYAMALEGAGHADEALPHYAASVNINPGSAQGHFNLGGAMQRRGDVVGAIVEYRRALAIYPAYTKASLNLGEILMNNGDFAAAAEVFGQAGEDEPQFASFHYFCRGMDAVQRGRFEDAIPELEHSRTLQPDFLMAHTSLGAALMKVGRAADAAREFRAALSLRPDDPATQQNLRAAMYLSMVHPATATTEALK